MVDKITLADVGSTQSVTSAAATVNANSALIETAFNNTVSRDGTTPNQMETSFDMNSNRILNLPQPIFDTEPIRLIDVGNASGYADAAAASAAAALVSQNSATASASSASTSAANALNYINGLFATSTTSLLIATGSKAFTIQTGKNMTPGQFLTAASNANSANYMHGVITSYNSGTGALVLNVLDIGGSGTLADWNLAVSGTQGPQGIQGIPGTNGAVAVSGTPTVNQFANWVDATTVKGTSITGLVKGNGASVPAAAVAGTDYLAPAAIGTTVLAYDAQLFSNIPQNSQSANYTLLITDAQKHIYHPSTDNNVRTFTIPANSSVAYPIGTAVTFINRAAATQNIAITTDTMYLGGTANTGTRALATNGMATAIKTNTTEWVISGTGIT